MSDTSPATAAYGAWSSPVRAGDVAAAAMSLGYVTAANGRLHWLESRPAERGRNALMTAGPDLVPMEVSPPGANVRSRVHEYGGRPYVVAGDVVVYSDYADQRLYATGRAEPLTQPGFRYADGVALSGTVYIVREDHTRAGEPVNAVIALDLEAPGGERVLFDRSDFVAYPRPSADGRLAFISWNHPNMPWDATSLCVGRLSADGLSDVRIVAGDPSAPAESVLEPVWADDGALYFLSDRSGFWNLYRWRGDAVEQVTKLDADLGGPLWNLGLSTYALVSSEHALVRICRNAVDRLALVDLATGAVTELPMHYAAIGFVGVLDARTGFAVAAPEDEPAALIVFDLVTGVPRIVRSAGSRVVPPEFVSRGISIEFPTTAAPDGAPRTAHALFHPPHNPGFTGPAGTKPPLMVLMHGGPTAHESPALKPSIQFWTTRGFAVVSVNYGGSTGYGRAYRERLRGEWGVVDRADAVAVVDHLAATGRIDGSRVVIRGGSAGGYTVLSCLAFTKRFTAGINYFGVADLELLVADTHKFESRYLDSMIAPLPEGMATYRARSPILHLDALDAALITFQGDEDAAVPPEQSRRIVAAVRARGRPVAYIEFKGEQHGFRQAQNIARALEAELYFLGKVFGFTPADVIEPVPIENLD
jgi:dienelactone hydrolase